MLKLAIMVLDVLIRYVPAMTHTTIGRSMYISTDKRALPNGLEVWQGYYQSARPTQSKQVIT
jgi:eukaryotic translation initiation factor 2C